MSNNTVIELKNVCLDFPVNKSGAMLVKEIFTRRRTGKKSKFFRQLTTYL